ncbi:MAG: cupredoxin domain-containing protein, partial [Patescibacteria group bacterium]
GGIWYVKNSNPMEPATENTGEAAQPSVALPATDSAGTQETVVTSDAKEIIVEASEFKFVPATLKLTKGEAVKLVLKNTGKMPHDFVIDELGVRTKVINGGDEDIIEFTPQQAGTFEYYCSVGKHRALGMKGLLTVE